MPPQSTDVNAWIADVCQQIDKHSLDRPKGKNFTNTSTRTGSSFRFRLPQKTTATTTATAIAAATGAGTLQASLFKFNGAKKTPVKPHMKAWSGLN